MKIRIDLAEILRISKLDWHGGGGEREKGRREYEGEESYFVILNHRRIPRGSFPQNFVKIRLDLAEILRISTLDWRDGGGKEGRGEEEGEESYFVIV